MNNKGRCRSTVQGDGYIFQILGFSLFFLVVNSMEVAMYVDIYLTWIMSVLAARDETVFLLLR